MKLVIDASVALKWVLDETGQEEALALIGQDLIAPDLWIIEASNALWRHVRQGEITVELARQGAATLLRAPVTAHSTARSLGLALDLAIELKHPVYDCLYLALAVAEQTTVVTADRRFHEAVRGSTFAGRVALLSG